MSPNVHTDRQLEIDEEHLIHPNSSTSRFKKRTKHPFCIDEIVQLLRMTISQLPFTRKRRQRALVGEGRRILIGTVHKEDFAISGAVLVHAAILDHTVG
jgi:hypothetical protein